MQRKLSEIAEIPKILSSTLATVSQTFEILKSTDLTQQKQQELLQYQQSRKHSYDEDALDYELTGASVTDDCVKLKAKGLKGAKVAKGKAKTKIYSTKCEVKKSQLAKDETPESDYASEGNYETNEADTDADYGPGDGVDCGSDVNDNRKRVARISGTSEDDSVETHSEGENYKKKYNYALRSMALVGLDSSDDDDDAEGEQQYSYVTRMRPAKSCQQKARKKQNASAARSTTTIENEDNHDNDDNDNDDSEVDAVTVRFVATECESEEETDEDNKEEIDDDNEDDEDFLTTTYTWSLRKIPKLQLNDESQLFDKSNAVKLEIDTDDTDEEKPNKKARWCHGHDDLQDDKNHATQWSEEEGAKEKKFYEKSEHFWPWADREKIIYKQSTCHLVRRRPLGLVEQRIKLLAKQNLGDSLERQLHGN